jgi:hypothetical protein
MMEDFEMATHNFIRWGGLISIIAAVLGIAYTFLNWDAVLIAGWSAGLLFFVLMLFAIRALYATQAMESGRLGRLGFILVTLGAIINIMYLFLSSLSQFAGIEQAGAVLGFFFNTIPLFVIGSPVWNVGLFLFGVATLRASVLPRWAGILLAASAILTLVAQISEFTVYYVLGIGLFPASLLMGIALAWMGWTLWSGKSRAVGRANPTA